MEYRLVNSRGSHILNTYATRALALKEVLRVANEHGWPALGRISLVEADLERQKVLASGNALVQLAKDSFLNSDNAS